MKQALLLLIQHNYVHAYMQREEDVKGQRPPMFLYAADVTAVLHIIR